jgi:hypothetical protein
MSLDPIYRGYRDMPPDPIQLRAGPLALLFEAGDLRYVRLGDREIVRRMYAAVRDRNWGTVPRVMHNLNIRAESDGFALSFDMNHAQAEIDFRWHGRITGDADGTLRFTLNGRAYSTFLRNRIGFCVLHPIRDCIGKPCTITKANGEVEQTQFPDLIAPYQPFVDMLELTYPLDNDTRIIMQFEGDLFEMEDQRNWLDASYKTYCTPLNRPFPSEIHKDTTVEQQITVRLERKHPTTLPVTIADNTIHITLTSGQPHPLPRLGITISPEQLPLTENEITRIRASGANYWQVIMDTDQDEALSKAGEVLLVAQRLGMPTEVCVLLDINNPNESCVAVAKMLRGIELPPIFAWHILPSLRTGAIRTTTLEMIQAARQQLTAFAPTAIFVAGNNANFTELNRERPSAELLALADMVSFSANPQVHSFDDASLVECCATFKDIAHSAHIITAGKPLMASQITLKPRFNAVATSVVVPDPTVLPPTVDLRQMSLFTAIWTVSSYKYLAESGVAYTTFFEAVGWCGITERDAGCALPDQFPSQPAMLFPVCHVMAALCSLRDGQCIPVESSNPLLGDALCIDMPDGTRHLFVANMTLKPQQISLDPMIIHLETSTSRCLSAELGAQVGWNMISIPIKQNSITLAAYMIVWIIVPSMPQVN